MIFARIAVCVVKLKAFHFQDIHVRAPEQNPYGAVTEVWMKLAAPILPVVTSGLSISLLGGEKYTVKYHFDVVSEASMNISGLLLLYDDESAPFLHHGKRGNLWVSGSGSRGPGGDVQQSGAFQGRDSTPRD